MVSPIASCRGDGPAPILAAAQERVQSRWEEQAWAQVLGFARSDTSIAPAAGRSWWSTASPISATCAARTAHRSSTCATPRTARSSPRSACRPARIRTRCASANGLMVVNHEINGADTSPVPADFRGGIGIYDVANPAKPREIARWDDRGQGRAPLRFRRPPRLHVADAGGLRRHRHDDHGPEGAGAAAGGRALVDAGAVDRRRRDSRPGRATRTAAITRCASATGSTPATGWPASSSSTSTT